MKKKRLKTLATVILGVICAALFLHLALRVRSVDAGAPPNDSARTPLRRFNILPSRNKATPFPGSPALNIALYQQLQSQTITPPGRDPFSFAPTPLQIREASRQRDQQEAAHNAAPGPPPPPPIPFKAVGYSITDQGQIEAYLSDSQQVYALHEGESFDKAYRVARITPGMIEIEDQSFHRMVELPFPQ